MIDKLILDLAEQVESISHIGLNIQRSNDLGVKVKEDNTFVTTADTLMEARLVGLLKEWYPGVPVLAEEGGGTTGLDLKRASESGVFSIDPLDGTFSFSAGLPNWSVSVAYVRADNPEFAIVAQPATDLLFAAERGKGVWKYDAIASEWCPYHRKPATEQKIGLDLARSFVKDDRCWEMARKLILEYNAPRVVPAVSLGIELLIGTTKFWIAAHTLKHWDVAAIALITEEFGGVAQTLEGGRMPWHEVRMPPLLFAQSREAADEARQVMGLV